MFTSLPRGSKWQSPLARILSRIQYAPNLDTLTSEKFRCTKYLSPYIRLKQQEFRTVPDNAVIAAKCIHTKRVAYVSSHSI